MKPTLGDFHSGIAQLVAFLDRTDDELALVGLLNERRKDLPEPDLALLDRLIAAATSTKQYVYVVAIVSLYGLLERLIDGLISRYVMRLGELSESFGRLPEVIRKNHLPQSLALAEALIKDKFRSETPQQIIANLNSCFSGAQEYKLNGSAFAFHRGNVNLNRISEMLIGVGTQNHIKRVVLASPLFNFLRALEPEREVRSMTDEALLAVLEPIDDLVARRNDVSHGVVLADDIQSVGLLRDRCAFVSAYGSGLHELLLQDALKFTSEIGVAHRLGQPLHVYDNRIVCFEASCRISVGDYLFAVTSDGLEPVRSSLIISLQTDNIDRPQIEAIAPDTIQFGALVGFHANPGYEYFSLPAGRL